MLFALLIHEIDKDEVRLDEIDVHRCSIRVTFVLKIYYVAPCFFHTLRKDLLFDFLLAQIS